MSSKKTSLTIKIFIGMLAGFVLGSLINVFGAAGPVFDFLTNGVFDTIGKIFLASLKLLVVPLVFISLVCGSASMHDVRKLGSIGGKTLLLYLVTTCIAISVALLAATLFKPGAGFNLTTDLVFQIADPPSLKETLIRIFPSNPIQAMAEGNMLQIIVFSILTGLAIAFTGHHGEPLLRVFESANKVVMKMVFIVMELAPYGVFCLIANVFAKQGFGAIAPLAKYFFIVVGVLIFHAAVIYPIFLKLFTNLNPWQFIKKFKDAIIFAFSTASSNATLPITLETVEEKLGVKNSVAAFTVPFGATINMDGTAIMQGVAAGFIAQAFGIDLSLGDYLMVIITATLASIGTAGVPGVGLIMLAMVLRQVNLPVEGIGLIIGVDRLLDMLRTSVNVIGDATVTCIVAKSEKQFDEKIFLAKD